MQSRRKLERSGPCASVDRDRRTLHPRGNVARRIRAPFIAALIMLGTLCGACREEIRRPLVSPPSERAAPPRPLLDATVGTPDPDDDASAPGDADAGPTEGAAAQDGSGGEVPDGSLDASDEPVCGNSRVEVGEECDRNDGVGCIECKRVDPSCGNGELETGEQCDVDDETCRDCRRVLPDGGICRPIGVLDPSDPVLNGSFTNDISGWTALGLVQVAHEPGRGSSSPGSLRAGLEEAMDGGATDGPAGVFQCVRVAAATTYELRASLLVPQGDARAFLAIQLYDSVDCSGENTEASETPVLYLAGAWSRHRSVTTTQARTRSVLLLAGLESDSDGEAFWDDLSLMRLGAIRGPSCGNCVLDDGEQCDDGGHSPSDGCDAACQLE